MPVKQVLHLKGDQPSLVGQFLAEPKAHQGKQVVRVASLEELINQPGADSSLPTFRGQEGESQKSAYLGVGVKGASDTRDAETLRVAKAVIRKDSFTVGSQGETEKIGKDAIEDKGSLVAPPGDPSGIPKGNRTAKVQQVLRGAYPGGLKPQHREGLGVPLSLLGSPRLSHYRTLFRIHRPGEACDFCGHQQGLHD
jgi:hypothetical protein